MSASGSIFAIVLVVGLLLSAVGWQLAAKAEQEKPAATQPATRPADELWGQAEQGMQVRVHAQKQQWDLNDDVSLVAGLRNQGAAFTVGDDMGGWALELDGKAFPLAHTSHEAVLWRTIGKDQMIEEWDTLILRRTDNGMEMRGRRHGALYEAVEISGRRGEAHMPPLAPGRHVIRLGFPLRIHQKLQEAARFQRPGQPEWIYSNSLTITVLDPAGNVPTTRPTDMQPAPGSAPALSFGPVIKRTMPRGEDGKDWAIDLDSGKLFDVPRELRNYSLLKELKAWTAERGVDLIFGEDNITFQLAVAGALWDSSARQVYESIRDYDGATPGGLPFRAVQFGRGRFDTPATQPFTPPAYAFKTREGGIGVLRLIPSNPNEEGDDPWSPVVIEYRMVLPVGAEPATRPAATQAAGPASMLLGTWRIRLGRDVERARAIIFRSDDTLVRYDADDDGGNPHLTYMPYRFDGKRLVYDPTGSTSTEYVVEKRDAVLVLTDPWSHVVFTMDYVGPSTNAADLITAPSATRPTATQASTRPAVLEFPLTLGGMIERTLLVPAKDRENWQPDQPPPPEPAPGKRFLSFVTGEVYELPPKLGGEEGRKWLLDHQVDVVGNRSPVANSPAVASFADRTRFKETKIPNAWLLNPVEFEVCWKSPQGQFANIDAAEYAAAGDWSDLPRTFLFRTRDGTKGILQIVKLIDNPEALQIRYRLCAEAAQGPSTEAATRPAATQAADAPRRPVDQFKHLAGLLDMMGLISESAKNALGKGDFESALAIWDQLLAQEESLRESAKGTALEKMVAPGLTLAKQTREAIVAHDTQRAIELIVLLQRSGTAGVDAIENEAGQRLRPSPEGERSKPADRATRPAATQPAAAAIPVIAELLIGSWTFNVDGKEGTWTFNADGSMTFTPPARDGPPDVGTSRWRLEGGELVITSPSTAIEDKAWMLRATTFRLTVAELSDRTLRLVLPKAYPDGRSAVYVCHRNGEPATRPAATQAGTL